MKELIEVAELLRSELFIMAGLAMHPSAESAWDKIDGLLKRADDVVAKAKEQAEAAVDYQEMIFALIRQGSFNDFDGDAVVDALKQHKELWEAVVFRDGNDSGYLLRDLPDEFHMDSLYIRASGKDDDALEQLMKELKADEVGWVEDSDTFRHLIRDRRVLRAWWD